MYARICAYVDIHREEFFDMFVWSFCFGMRGWVAWCFLVCLHAIVWNPTSDFCFGKRYYAVHGKYMHVYVRNVMCV